MLNMMLLTDGKCLDSLFIVLATLIQNRLKLPLKQSAQITDAPTAEQPPQRLSAARMFLKQGRGRSSDSASLCDLQVLCGSRRC